MKVKTRNIIRCCDTTYYETGNGEWSTLRRYVFDGFRTTSQVEGKYPKPHTIIVAGTFSIENHEVEIEVE